MKTEVLIVGAGPTGLVLALWLTKQGTEVRIIDKLAGTASRSRAVIVQARTLELYQQLGLAEEVLARGHKVDAINVWMGSEHRVSLPFGQLGGDATPYPFVYNLPQDIHENMLVEKLVELGVGVDRNTELLDFVEDDMHIIATLRLQDGSQEELAASFIVGCDGAHSAVRRIAEIGFEGDVYPQLFYVADIEATGPTIDGNVHVNFNSEGVLLCFGYDKGTKARLLGVIDDNKIPASSTTSRDLNDITFDEVSPLPIDLLKLEISAVNWFSPYRVHHRVASHFRKGRAFLAGDAAHVHSPAGGQGMNTGIGDAINLAWKLSAALQDRTANPDVLLDSYEPERIAFARRLVNTTDRAFSTMTARGAWAKFLRTWIVALVLPWLFSFAYPRRMLFRTVSQTLLNYRGSRFAMGVAGTIAGGDRLPWVKSSASDNFEATSEMEWSVHVYGSASKEVKQWCEANRVALYTFDWTKEHGRKGLLQGAAYLLRPDLYIAVADPEASCKAFETIFAQNALRLPLE